MAANISNSPQRVDYARAEHDDENSQGDTATPDGQTPSPSEATIAAPTEQQGQSGDGSSSDAGTHDSSDTPPSPTEPEAPTPLPAQFRYGLSEVSIGRPVYARVAIEQTDRARPDSDAINPRPTALAPTLRAENTPSPAIPAANAVVTSTKPIPQPKPGSTIAPDTSASPPPPAWPAVPASTITHGPVISGEAMEPPPPTNHQPAPTAGLHTSPEQSPHYALAQAYGREHGYKDDEIMKLAVLMQNNRDANMGREWLSLKPTVLRAAVNAVVRNPDNSFDTSGVFGGQLGYPRVNFQRIPADASTAAYQFAGDGAPQYASAPPEGWILIEQEVVSPGGSGDGGSDSTTSTLRYYIPENEINQTDESAYLPLGVAGYMQVPPGIESELSVGADGGVNDLGALDFDPEYGLITRTDNYRPYSADGNDWDRFMEIVVIASISYGAGGALGAIMAPAGASTATVIATGAAQGALGSAVGTMLQGGDISFRGLLQSALSGGLLAGLGTLESYQGLRGMGLDRAGNVTSYALRALSITGTSTLRGAIQALTGGSFRDGFTQGIAQGLSSEITRFLNTEITAGLARNDVTPTQATALRELTRFTGSAIRAASNPNDPMSAFAQDYLTQLLGPAEPTNINGGNNRPVDAETQQQMIWMQDAIDLGYTDTAATHFNNILERRAAANPTTPRNDIANQLIRELGIKPDTLGFVVGANGRVTVDPATVVTARVDRPTAVARLAAAYRLNDPTISQLDAERAANDRIDRYGIPVVFPERLMLEVVVRPDKPLPFTTGSEIVDRIIGAVQGSVMTGYNYVSGLLHGVVDITKLSADGLLDIVNKLIGEDIFPDSAQRNTARADMLNNIVANLDQLPAQVAQYFNGRLERANQLDAQGDFIGAARERTELIGDLISMVTNPRTPNVMRILERLGVDPVVFERTSRAQREFRDAAIAQEHRVNPAFANADMSLFEAHHTIPINAFPELNAIRAQLREWGIDINSVENGVMLPGRNAPAGLQGTYHSLLSDPGYGIALAERFRGVTTAPEARALLTKINSELRNGTFQFTPTKK